MSRIEIGELRRDMFGGEVGGEHIPLKERMLLWSTSACG